MQVKHNCSDCQHRRDALMPCEWLEQQDHIILDCPRYEKEKPGENNITNPREGLKIHYLGGNLNGKPQEG